MMVVGEGPVEAFVGDEAVAGEGGEKSGEVGAVVIWEEGGEGGLIEACVLAEGVDDAAAGVAGGGLE
jgi:hypothetical protein